MFCRLIQYKATKRRLELTPGEVFRSSERSITGLGWMIKDLRFTLEHRQKFSRLSSVSGWWSWKPLQIILPECRS